MLRLLFTIGVFILFYCASLGAADNLTPSPEQIKQQLERLEQSQDSQATHLQEIYQNSLHLLQSAQEYRQRSADYNAVVQNFPQQIGALERQLLNDTQVKVSVREDASVAELQQQLALHNAQLVELQSELNNLTSQLLVISNRRQTLPGLLSQKKVELTEVQSKIGSITEPGELAEALRTQAKSQRSELVAAIKALELEQLSSDNRKRLTDAEQHLRKQRVDDLRSVVSTLQETIASKRQQEAERAIADAGVLSSGESPVPAIAEALQDKQRLSEQLQEVSDQIAQTSRESQVLMDKLRAAEETQKRIQAQLNQPGLSTAAGANLRAQLANLPELRSPRQLHRQLAAAQLDAYTLEQTAATIASVQDYSAYLESQTGTSLSGDLVLRLEPIITARRDLVNTLQDNYSAYINELAQLELVTQQYNSLIATTGDQIAEHLLWLPNTLPLNRQWLVQVSRNLQWIASHISLGDATQVLRGSAETIIGGLIAAVFATITWWLGRRRLPYLVTASGTDIGKVSRDRFGATIHLAAAILFYASPLPLLFYGVGLALAKTDGYPLLLGLGDGLMRSAMVYYCYAVWIRASVPEGLFVRHFGWQSVDYLALRQRLRPVIWSGLILLILYSVGEHPLTSHLNNGVGRAAFLILCALTSFGFLRAIRCVQWSLALSQSEHPNALRNLATALLTGLPLIFGLLAALGYYFTGVMLLVSLLSSLLVVLLWTVVYAMGVRWLLVTERQMALARAKSRRAELMEQRDNEERQDTRPPDTIDEAAIDLQTISQHSMVLLKTLIIIGVAISLSVLWSDLVQALNFLDQISIWETYQAGENGNILQQVTLKALLYAVAVLVLMLVAVRNLPGVMEIVVLQHLSLAPGTGYAVTSLLKYLLVAAGLLYSFQILGFEWAKIQWLIAALGVGLGFGLQEIFANFVSGLILLFEKPIRIGDTVTINNLTGTITRINIRATTIVDWDRKEIIVPNKAFITDQLVNWSLSDAVTRLVFKVGVAYGSDNAKVAALLLEAANEVPQILEKPKPEAFFIAFGNSTLDYELRVFVNDMSHRLPVTHAVHNLIDAKFRESGIEIAFPQLDVKLKRH